MKIFFIILILVAAHPVIVTAQYKISYIVADSLSKEPLAGAVFSFSGFKDRAVLTNSSGIANITFPDSQLYNITVSSLGFRSKQIRAQPGGPDSTMILLIAANEVTDEEVVVTSTRTEERIETAASKVEVLGKAEMAEEGTLKPGNIASILGDVSGVQIQQSSLPSGNANVRIQGLEGKYTQILRDGIPLFGGYAGGFGVLSVAPLDLQQIELIKGSSSTLYGGGAIAGLINLVSKKPGFKKEAGVTINAASLGEKNINVFYSKRDKKKGISFFAGQNFQSIKDIDHDSLSDLPRQQSLTLHPVVFFYPSEQTTFSLGWSGNYDARKGGDLQVVKGKAGAGHRYFESNRIDRNIFTFYVTSRTGKGLNIFFKNSIATLSRRQSTDRFYFKGQQVNYFSEFSVQLKSTYHSLTAGGGINGYRFLADETSPVAAGSYRIFTPGIFVQDTWQINAATKAESGIRLDRNRFGSFLLPRFAIFHRLSGKWGSRAGFGLGYTNPDPLTPQLKDYDIQKIQPLQAGVRPERSFGGNVELNYKNRRNEDKSFFVNGAYFLTALRHPFTANESASGEVFFRNENKAVVTQGIDIYWQAKYGNVELYAGYTFTKAIRRYLPTDRFVPLTPVHRAAATFLYEYEESFRIGVETSFTGPQKRLEDHANTRSYVFAAALAEKKFGPKWSIVLNCENLFDIRQSKYEHLNIGTTADPVFRGLWAPTDGRVTNVSLTWRPFAE